MARHGYESTGDRLTIAPKVTRSKVRCIARSCGVRFTRFEFPDCLSTAVLNRPRRGDRNLVAAFPELPDRFIAESRFQDNGSARFNAPARGIECGLRILSMQNRAQHDLRVSLRLHEPAHDAECHDWLIVSCDKCRNDRV